MHVFVCVSVRMRMHTHACVRWKHNFGCYMTSGLRAPPISFCLHTVMPAAAMEERAGMKVTSSGTSTASYPLARLSRLICLCTEAAPPEGPTASVWNGWLLALRTSPTTHRASGVIAHATGFICALSRDGRCPGSGRGTMVGTRARATAGSANPDGLVNSQSRTRGL